MARGAARRRRRSTETPDETEGAAAEGAAGESTEGAEGTAGEGTEAGTIVEKPPKRARAKKLEHDTPSVEASSIEERRKRHQANGERCPQEWRCTLCNAPATE